MRIGISIVYPFRFAVVRAEIGELETVAHAFLTYFAVIIISPALSSLQSS